MNSVSLFSTLMMYSGLGLGLYSYHDYDESVYNASQIITVELIDQGEEGTDETVSAIVERLDAVYDYNVYYDVSDNIIEVSIPGYEEVKEAINIMQATGRMEIRETLVIDKIWEGLKRADAKANQLPELIVNYSDRGLCLTGQEHVIGWVDGPKKMQKLDSLIKSADYAAEIPADAELAWAHANDYGGLMFKLVALKKDAPSARIRSGMIEDVEQSYDDQYRDVITMRLAPEYIDLWADITTRNQSKAMAVVVDGIVVSEPVVMEPILNGYVSLHVGQFLGGTNYLAQMLKRNPIEDKVLIRSVDWSPDSR